MSGSATTEIVQWTLKCAQLLVSKVGDEYQVAVGPIIDAFPLGNGGVPFPAVMCPPGQVAVGQRGRSGAIVQALGFGCAKPSLKF